MTESRMKFDPTVTLGTIIQMIVLIGSLLSVYLAFDHRTVLLEYQVSEQGKTIQEIKAQTNRIERYLVSQDPQYWKKTKENGAEY